MQQIQGSMDEMQVATAESIEAMGVESAQDLLEEIKIAIGESLQPGEAEKFLYIAEEQEKLSSLTEFSFFGPDGMVELSSSTDAKGVHVIAAVSPSLVPAVKAAEILKRLGLRGGGRGDFAQGGGVEPGELEGMRQRARDLLRSLSEGLDA